MAYEIQVSARILSWPRLCACCCADADTVKRASASRTTGKRVRHTTTSSWEVPYCTSCLSHEGLFGWAAAILVGSVAAIVMILLIASFNHATVAGWLLTIGAGGIGGWASSSVRQRGRAQMKPGCAARRGAVAYAGWYGTFHTFVFASRDYLDAFAAANARKTMSDVRRV